MERETTGLYLSGHPMDEHRELLNRRRIPSLAGIMESVSSADGKFIDEQEITVAGVVQSVKTKTTRNNSMMAYVTLEDATAPMELLVFSGPLGRFGSLLAEGSMVVVDGRLSVRDEKDPQIIVNSVRNLAELKDTSTAEVARQPVRKIYLRLPSENSPLYDKVKAILELFVGNTPVVLFFADTRLRRGTTCLPDEGMLMELRRLLGDENVVLQM